MCVPVLSIMAGLAGTQAPSAIPEQGRVRGAPLAQGGRGTATQQAMPQTMDQATARKLVAATEAAAAALNHHVAICVLDTNRDVAFLAWMDGVTHMTELSS